MTLNKLWIMSISKIQISITSRLIRKPHPSVLKFKRFWNLMEKGYTKNIIKSPKKVSQSKEKQPLTIKFVLLSRLLINILSKWNSFLRKKLNGGRRGLRWWRYSAKWWWTTTMMVALGSFKFTIVTSKVPKELSTKWETLKLTKVMRNRLIRLKQLNEKGLRSYFN